MTQKSGAMLARVIAEMGTVHYPVALHIDHHRLTADEPASAGGGNVGPSPFALLLAGLGSCTAITLRMYAERKGWPLADVRIDLAYMQDDGGTAHIERRLSLSGDLDEAQRARLLEIADKTPVTRALRSGTEIQTTLI